MAHKPKKKSQRRGNQSIEINQIIRRNQSASSKSAAPATHQHRKRKSNIILRKIHGENVSNEKSAEENEMKKKISSRRENDERERRKIEVIFSHLPKKSAKIEENVSHTSSYVEKPRNEEIIRRRKSKNRLAASAKENNNHQPLLQEREMKIMAKS